MALFCAHAFVATSMLVQLLRAAQSGCDAEFHALRKAIGALMLASQECLQAVQASRAFESAGLQATLVLCRRRHGWQAQARGARWSRRAAIARRCRPVRCGSRNSRNSRINHNSRRRRNSLHCNNLRPRALVDSRQFAISP